MVVKMVKLYLMVAIGALVCGAYFYGVNITRTKCRAESIQNSLIEIQQIQKNKKEIHETVYKTGVADIRCILRDEYTIAE